MVENVFGQSPVSMALDNQRKSLLPQPAPLDPKTEIEGLARTSRVPVNVLMAIGEAAGSKSPEDALAIARNAADRLGPMVAAGKTVDQALTEILGDQGPQATAALMSRAWDIADSMYPVAPAPSAPAGPEKNNLRDTAAMLGKSVFEKGIGGTVRGAGELNAWAANKIAVPINMISQALTGRDFIPKADNILKDYAENIAVAAAGTFDPSISADATAAVLGSQMKGSLFDPSTWDFGDNPTARGYALQAVDVFGTMVPMLAAAFATGGSTIVAAGMGGAQSAGDQAQASDAIIDQMAKTMLPNGKSLLEAQSSTYQRYLAQGMSHEEAMKATKRDGSQAAAAFAAPIGAAGGAVTAKLVNPASKILTGANLPGRVAGRAAIGAVEEGTQEVAEVAAGRMGANQATGLDLDPMENTLGDFVLGAIAGGATGAAGGALSRREGDQRSAPPVTPTPDASVTPPPPPAGPLTEALRLGMPPSSTAFTEGEEFEIAEDGSTPFTATFVRDTGFGPVFREADGAEITVPREDIDAGMIRLRPGPDGQPDAAGSPAILGGIGDAAADPGVAGVHGQDIAENPAGQGPLAQPPVSLTGEVDGATPDNAPSAAHVEEDAESGLDQPVGGGGSAPVLGEPGDGPGPEATAADGEGRAGRGSDAGSAVGEPSPDLKNTGNYETLALPGEGRARAAGIHVIHDGEGGFRVNTDHFIQGLESHSGGAKGTFATVEEARVAGAENVLFHAKQTAESKNETAAHVRKAKAIVAWAKKVIADNATALPSQSDDNAPVTDAIAEAAALADPAPTEAQKDAGNFRLGHAPWNGFNLSIENAKGSERKGKAPDGTEWAVTMPAHYGYFKGTVGADGDHLDFYMGDDPSSLKVLVIDQIDLATGAFDESKVMIGFASGREARQTYIKGFSDGKGEARIGGTKAMNLLQFQEWAKSEAAKAPASKDVAKVAEPAEKPAGVATPEPAQVAESKPEKVPSIAEKADAVTASKTPQEPVDEKNAVVADDARPADAGAEPEPVTADDPAPILAEKADAPAVSQDHPATPDVTASPEERWDAADDAERKAMLVAGGFSDGAAQRNVSRDWKDLTATAQKAVAGGGETDRIIQSDIPVTLIKKDVAVTPTGRRIDVEYGIVDLDSMIASNSDDGRVNPAYPQERQPRDRTKDGSQLQIDRNLAKFDPRQLGESPNAGDGAPIIDRAGIVESGNGRTMGLQRIYRDRPDLAEQYRDYLAAQGYPIEGVAKPVLVRIRRTELTDEEINIYTKEMNSRTTLEMTAKEQAVADAESLPDSALSLYRGGDLDAVGNADFVRAFISAVVPPNEQAKMRDDEGSISQDAIRRVQNALLAKAYGDGKIIAKLIESVDTNMKAIGGAILDVSPRWAQMRAAAKTGQISDMAEQTDALLEAIAVVNRARTNKRNIAEFVSQADLITGDAGMSLADKGFLSMMFRDRVQWTRPVGREMMAKTFDFYVEQMMNTQPGTDIFGGTVDPTAAIAVAVKKQDDDYDNANKPAAAGDLFAARPASSGGDGKDVRALRKPGGRTGPEGAGPRDGGEDAGGQVGKESRGDGARFSRASASLTTSSEAAPSPFGLEDGPVTINLDFAEDEINGIAADPPLTDAAIDKITKDLRAALKALGLGRISVEAVRRLVSNRSGNPIQGVYNGADGGKIRVRADAASGPFGVLDHEAIHALRSARYWNSEYGLFTADEWKALVARAKKEPDIGPRIERLYPDLPYAGRMEEAVAELFRMWREDQRIGDAGIIDKALAKIADFFEALANALRGNGFISAAGVMDRIASGKVGRRAGAAQSASAMAAEMRADPFPPPLTDTQSLNLIQKAIVKAQSGDLSLLGLVPGRGLFAELGKHIMAAQTYMKFKGEMDSMREEWFAKADAVVQSWRKLISQNLKANAELMALMHETTIAGIDPSKPFERRASRRDHDAVATLHKHSMAYIDAQARIDEDRSRYATYRDMRARFDALPAPFRAMFGEVRDNYSKLADAFEATVLENIQKAATINIRKAERAHADELARIDDEGLVGGERYDAVEASSAKLSRVRRRLKWGGAARVASMRAIFESNRVEGPYFPLTRFGEFFATVRDADGKIVAFSRFESVRDRDQFAIAEKRINGQTVETGVMEDFDARSAVDPNFVAEIEAMLGDAGVGPDTLDAIWQKWLTTLPELSVRRNRIHRKGTAGYDSDAFRAFGRHMFHGAHQLARLKFSLEMDDALIEAGREAQKGKDPTRDGLLVKEMKLRHKNTMNPQGAWWAQAATSAAFIWYLGMSPANALINISQTTMIGIPVLATLNPGKGGFGQAASQITRATLDFTRGKFHAMESPRLTTDEKDALREAYRSGLIDRSQAHDLAGVAQTGIEPGVLSRVAVRAAGLAGPKAAEATKNLAYKLPTATRVMAAFSFLQHHTERMNREVTFLAAYRMAKLNGAAPKQAIEKAADLTWRAHFDYQSNNRPRFMQGNNAKVLFVFRNYSVNALWRLFRDGYQAFAGDTPEARREARKQLYGISVMMALHAGISGTWLFGMTMMIAGLVFGMSKDDVEEELKGDIVEMFGPEIGGAMWYGLPGRSLGISLTERIGMPNLWFRSSDRDLEGSDEYYFWLSQILGASFSIPLGVFRGMQLSEEGHTERGIEAMVPKVARDLMKATRYAFEGAVTKNGDPLVDEVPSYDILKTALGFTPAQIAERSEINSRLYQVQQEILDRRSKVLGAAAKAIMAEGQLPNADKAAIDAFNAEYPEAAITADGIRQSVRSRLMMRERSEYGAALDPRLNDRLREERAEPVFN